MNSSSASDGVGSQLTSMTAQPAVAPPTRGFGPLLEQEHALEVSVRDNLLFVTGPRSADIRRILEGQQGRIAGGISLLEERVDALPYPERFHSLARPRPLAAAGMPAPRRTGLADLASQHLNLQSGILTLIERRPEGGRPELLLVAVARSHEEMAAMLSTLLNDEDQVRDRELPPIIAAAAAGPGEEKWENEGGAPRPAPLKP